MKKRKIKVSFYDEFKCIASECPITCCREWKIAVDERTRTKWEQTPWSEPGSTEADGKLSDYLTEKDDSQIICLKESMDCQFLNEQKLCDLVTEYGDAVLSKTCREFPRQIHEFEDRIEYSLTALCPVVIDLFYKTEEITFCEEDARKEASEDWLLQMKNLLIDCMKDKSYTIEHALQMGFYLLLEANEATQYTKKDVVELSDALSDLKSDAADTFFECNELFLDITENYRKQGIYLDFLEPLIALAEQFEENSYQKEMTEPLEARDTEEKLMEDMEKFEASFGEYENLLRNYLVSEMYGQLLLPEYDWENMVVAMQWIGMEYVVMRQALFLNWKSKKQLTYEMVKETIVYVARMTGYDEADIFEYFEECFESPIWEWGYFAFIVGDRRKK